MIGKVNIALLFLICVIIAFFGGVQFSDDVKSALHLGDSITQIGEQQGQAETASVKAEDAAQEVSEAANSEVEAGEDAGESDKSEKTGTVDQSEETDVPSDNDTGNVMDNVTVTAEERFSEPTEFKYGVNSADGITLTWNATNLSGKTINYYTVNISTSNPVGDPSYDQQTGESTFQIPYVGPIGPNEELGVFHLFTYQGALHTVTIDSIDLEYADGTKETVQYNRSTSDNSGMDD
jgi:hypothetical protein